MGPKNTLKLSESNYFLLYILKYRHEKKTYENEKNMFSNIATVNVFTIS